MKAKRRSRRKHMSKDRISSLPSIIIDTILCGVPIRDAVRTSILSRKWRYNWVTIPKLVFNEKDMFDNSNDEQRQERPPNERKQLTRKCKIFYAIHQVLLLHHGPIVEFNLSMQADKTCVEIDQIILHLSKNNTLKKLALDLAYDYLYRLPLSVIYLQNLTNLYLNNRELDFNPTHSGLGSLTTLSVKDALTCGKLLHLVSNCPLLKSLSLIEEEHYSSCVDIVELSKCLPGIEHLSVTSWIISEWPVPYSATQELPTKLVYLKSLYIYHMVFFSKDQLLALFLMIRSSPNLEKIMIQMYEDDSTESEIDIGSFTLDEYSHMWLEHLIELKIKDFSNLKSEFEFVKLILAKSPVLEKVSIELGRWVHGGEELKMLRILVSCPRASPVVEISIV